jgi:hypothetical protein
VAEDFENASVKAGKNVAEDLVVNSDLDHGQRLGAEPENL